MDIFRKISISCLILLLCILLVKLGVDLARMEDNDRLSDRPYDKVYINNEENNSYIDTVNYMGESHEYFIYINHGKTLGISHWEGCSFCKKNGEIEDGEK